MDAKIWVGDVRDLRRTKYGDEKYHPYKNEEQTEMKVMTDIEKIIDHLNDCMESSRRSNTWVFVRKDIIKDVFTLLKEQEADKNKYEYKHDHTDCLWYGSGNCPSTCSQYRDGWNDAMDYIFKDGKGYQPCRRSVK